MYMYIQYINIHVKYIHSQRQQVQRNKLYQARLFSCLEPAARTIGRPRYVGFTRVPQPFKEVSHASCSPFPFSVGGSRALWWMEKGRLVRLVLSSYITNLVHVDGRHHLRRVMGGGRR